jgi:uncharacterized membrane protein YiaA
MQYLLHIDMTENCLLHNIIHKILNNILCSLLILLLICLYNLAVHNIYKKSIYIIDFIMNEYGWKFKFPDIF